MELTHLQTFVAVYRSGNLTAAAAARHLSQPAVTAHLKALEAELGRPLFVRLPRGVSPTPLADTLAAEVGAPIDALAATSLSFRAGAEPGDATCFLGGPADALAALVLPALVPLTNRGLRLRVTTGDVADLVPRVGDGDLDLAVATRPTRYRNVGFEPLFTETLVLVAAPGFAAELGPAGRATGTGGGVDVVGRDGAAVLADRPLVAYAESAPLVRRYWRTVFGAAEYPDPRIVVGDLRAVLAVTEAGGGWTVLPDYLIGPALWAGRLQVLHHPRTPPTNPLHLAVNRRARDRPYVQAVVAHLHDRLRPPAG